ncbi:SDR family oxidoreductase [Streptomyces sp. NPDC054796]
MSRSTLVVIGTGGMGQAVARRIGSGHRLLLADHDTVALDAAAERLRAEGHEVATQPVDVSSREAVHALAERAAALGPVTRLVHTAGLSPVQADIRAVLAVDLLGVALVVEEFTEVVQPGGAGVVIASMAGYNYTAALSPEQEAALATTPADELLGLPFAAEDAFAHSGAAYSFAKRANQLRMRHASVTWGARGARINSVSPGIIATPMGQAELDNSSSGRYMRAALEGSNAGRLGTPEDIAHAVDFLLGPAAGFISGTDLLVDGGVTAATQAGHIAFT